jgi:hypothetical protein
MSALARLYFTERELGALADLVDAEMARSGFTPLLISLRTCLREAEATYRRRQETLDDGSWPVPELGGAVGRSASGECLHGQHESCRLDVCRCRCHE